MSKSKKVYIINPMVSKKPTGMGVAGESIVRNFEELRLPAADKAYSWINDVLKVGALRILARQIVTEWFCWRNRSAVLIFTTHQGPLFLGRDYIVVLLDLICVQRPFQNRVQAVSYLVALPRVLQRARAVVTISRATMNVASRLMPQLQGKEMRVIPCTSWRLDGPGTRGLPIRERVSRSMFLFVGAGYYHKRFDVAVAVIAKVREVLPHVRMTVVGVKRDVWKPLFDEGPGALEKLGVDVIDYASNAELEELFRNACGLLYLSEVEGFGLPPLEGMKLGCPAICNDIPELRETAGDAALFVKTEEPGAIANLLVRICRGEMNALLEENQDKGFAQAAKYVGSAARQNWGPLIAELHAC